MSDYSVSDTDLIAVANAIRTKGDTSAQLEFPTEFVSAIAALPSSTTLGTKTITSVGTYTASSDNLDGYSSVTVTITNYDGVSF